MSPSVVDSPVTDIVDQLIADEEQVFLRRQPRSTELIAEAGEHLAGGATSNWQIAEPQAVWMSHGAGSKVYDVDGNEYVDMHGGYGASIAGHAHPAIVEAVSDRVRRGTHFAQPTEDAIWIAGELARRFDLPLWRFANSGTEATMDAVHLARALTGRDLIIKVEGCYHGHHDSVQVSVLPEADEVGPRDYPTPVPGNSGIPAAIRDLVIVVPFNDTSAVARALAEHRGQVAAMILEPVMIIILGSIVGLIAASVRALLNRTQSDDMVRLDHVERLRVESHRSQLAVSLDGEVVSSAPPLNYVIRKQALRVIAPG